MTHTTRAQACTILTLLCLGALSLGGCFEAYNSPPEAELVQAEGGAYLIGDKVRINFSEAVKDDSIRVRVWPSERTAENELPADAVPLVDTCSIKDGMCGKLELDARRNKAGEVRAVTLDFDSTGPDGLGKPGAALLVELLPGLSDLEGADTGRSAFYSVVFNLPPEPVNNVTNNTTNNTTPVVDPVEFTPGVWVWGASISQPIPAVLTLIGEAYVTERGDFYFSGAEGDEIGDAPQTTINPEELIVDETMAGFVIQIKGKVRVLEDGSRVLTTEPKTVTIPVSGLGEANLVNAIVVGSITRGDDGFDSLSGTLSFEKASLDLFGSITDFEGTSTELNAVYAPPAIAPAGAPTLCDNPCGAVTANCDPDPNLVPEEDCEEIRAWRASQTGN